MGVPASSCAVERRAVGERSCEIDTASLVEVKPHIAIVVGGLAVC